MKVNIYYNEKGFEYLLLTIAIPPTNDVAMQSALSELQNGRSSLSLKYSIFDVRSSSDKEEWEIDILIHTKTGNLGSVIVMLKRIELKAWGKEC